VGLLRLLTHGSATLRPAFDAVMNKVERLVRQQISSLQKKGHTPNVSEGLYMSPLYLNADHPAGAFPCWRLR
jgi:hypothetical protein